MSIIHDSDPSNEYSTNGGSIRISTKKTYNHGLFIADIASMPHGCSTWPAYWSVGPNWPMAGVVDFSH